MDSFKAAPLAVQLTVGAAVGLLTILIGYAFTLRSARSKCPKWNEIDEKVIKNGASAKKLQAVAEEGVDYIVVGSGLAGMTTASLLAKVGHKVLVLEQHDVAGGATHTFTEKGFEFDVGIHYIGERMTTNLSPCRRMFEVISDGGIEWSECDDKYDFYVNDKTGDKFGFGRDHGDNMKRLEEKFPGCGPALRRYRRASQLAKLSGASLFLLKLFPLWVLRLLKPIVSLTWGWSADRTAIEVMQKCGLKDEELIGVLTYLYGDYGLPPGRVAFLVQALLETHYEGGAFFPRGGSSSIAKTVVAAINRRGGHVLVRAPVEKINVEELAGGGFKATGVTCKGVDIKAKLGVISNAGATNTFKYLLPEKAAAPNLAPLERLGVMEPSVQLCYLFVGLDKTDAELNLPACNMWILGGHDHDAQFDKLDAADTFEDIGFLPAIFLSFGSSKDDRNVTREKKGGATLQLLAPVKYEWFEAWKDKKHQHRGGDYEAEKKIWADRLLAKLYKYFPQCEGHVEFHDVGTPLTTDFYLNTKRGETYGLTHKMPRFCVEAQEALHTQTGVQNLTMCGQDHFSVGIVAALGSGYITAGYLSKKALANGAAEVVFAS